MSAVFAEASAVSGKYAVKVYELLLIGLYHPLVALEAYCYPAVGSDIGDLTLADEAALFALLRLILEYSLYVAVSADILNSKADIDLSNVPSSKGILTECYVNGSSWYRVYSDKWCEQGGLAPSTSGDSTTKSVAFLKNYSNTTYTVLTTMEEAQTVVNPNLHCFGVRNRTTSGFQIWNNSSYLDGVFWQACGYIN